MMAVIAAVSTYLSGVYLPVSIFLSILIITKIPNSIDTASTVPTYLPGYLSTKQTFKVPVCSTVQGLHRQASCGSLDDRQGLGLEETEDFREEERGPIRPPHKGRVVES